VHTLVGARVTRFLVAVALSLSILVMPSAQAFEGHSLVTREPYLPQKFDLGGSLGAAFSTSPYILIEALAGFHTTSCGFHCWYYIDLQFRTAAQNGETNYQALLVWRFQKFFDGSSWGPYARVFAGNDHYLFSGQVNDWGLFGAALGTYYFLHPGADLRLEAAQAWGPIPFSSLLIGVVFKFRNI